MSDKSGREETKQEGPKRDNEQRRDESGRDDKWTWDVGDVEWLKPGEPERGKKPPAVR